jgi:hypothetical protein
MVRNRRRVARCPLALAAPLFTLLLAVGCGGGGDTQVETDEAAPPTTVAPPGFERVGEFSGTGESKPGDDLFLGPQQVMITWELGGTVQEFKACLVTGDYGLGNVGCVQPRLDIDPSAERSGQRFFKAPSYGYGRLEVGFLGSGSWRVLVYRQGPPPPPKVRPPPKVTPAVPSEARADAAAQLPQRVAEWKRIEDRYRKDCLTPAYPGDNPEPKDWQPGVPPTVDGGGTSGNCNRLR